MARGSAEARPRCIPKPLTLSAQLWGAWRLSLGVSLDLLSFTLRCLAQSLLTLTQPRMTLGPSISSARLRGVRRLGLGVALDLRLRVHGGARKLDLGVALGLLTTLKHVVSPAMIPMSIRMFSSNKCVTSPVGASSFDDDLPITFRLSSRHQRGVEKLADYRLLGLWLGES
ncbi:hypothetical protein BHM03_00027722 [Ensete ventricosum]|nr:hypothetical protein BHM03_00027722 [Ensete ventricosum]